MKAVNQNIQPLNHYGLNERILTVALFKSLADVSHEGQRQMTMEATMVKTLQERNCLLFW